MEENATDGLPLAGVTVVELCHSVAGPYAGSILADLGADVIKVEAPGTGDYARDWGPPFAHGTSTLFHVLNHNKRGLALDLRDRVTCERLLGFILDHADVVLQNMRPGAIDKLGLGAAALRARKPALITCDLGAYGRSGPLKDRPGYDPLMQAHGGIMSVTGIEGGEPVRVGVSIVDQGAGMWAAMGILAALNKRHVTGQGSHVSTSLFETAIAWMSPHIGGYLSGGAMRRPLGSGVTEIVPHQAFPTSDGYIMVAAGNDNLFRALCGAIGHDFAADARFATNSNRVENRRTLIPLLEDIFRVHASAEWQSRLDAAGVPAAPIENVAQVLASPQTAALGILQQAPDLDLTLAGLPLEFDGVRPRYRHSAPALGQHNDLLSEPIAPEKAAS
ncbi:MAG: CoA transferase [Alphaproteobacteria bacterium]|nr:MAG: CoA transferase [Alphaproteobacteria bacterium]